MKKDLTELVLILDKSGSMTGLESDTIGGFNSMLKKQKELPGECRITTVLFDNDYELLHDRIDIRAVNEMSEKEYCIGGSTALLDAIGRTISKIGNAQKQTAEDYRADKVLFVIITDGMENSSRKYSSDQVKYMVERQKKRYGWEFIFLGANIDAAGTARQYGIDASRAQRFHSDKQGVELNFTVMNQAVSEYRLANALSDDWSEAIQKDYEKRGSRH